MVKFPTFSFTNIDIFGIYETCVKSPNRICDPNVRISFLRKASAKEIESFVALEQKFHNFQRLELRTLLFLSNNKIFFVVAPTDSKLSRLVLVSVFKDFFSKGCLNI